MVFLTLRCTISGIKNRFCLSSKYITEEVHNGKLQRSRTEVGDLIILPQVFLTT